MNSVSIVGRLTKEPVVIKTKGDKSVVNTTIAINRDYKNAQGEREVDFVTVNVWGSNAENLAKYTTKGSLIGIVGQLRSRNYDDKGGVTHFVTEVQADSVEFLETQAQTEARKAKASEAAAAQA